MVNGQEQSSERIPGVLATFGSIEAAADYMRPMGLLGIYTVYGLSKRKQDRPNFKQLVQQIRNEHPTWSVKRVAAAVWRLHSHSFQAALVPRMSQHDLMQRVAREHYRLHGKNGTENTSPIKRVVIDKKHREIHLVFASVDGIPG